MTVRLEAHAIVLEGACGVEQVEPLLAQLEAHSELPVDIGGVEGVHTALWQVILMVRPKLVGTPASTFVGNHLLRALEKSYL